MNKARILVADDDRLVRYTLVTGLRDAGYGVEEAEDGEQALAICKAFSPDVALLDIRMPGISGLELAHRLRAETTIPFLFLSAYGDAETVKQGIVEGALGYLVKPLDIAQIIPAIELALARAEEITKLKSSEDSLSTALKDSRETGPALGLIMARYGLSQKNAFEGLRAYARSQRRRVRDVATEILEGREPSGLEDYLPNRLGSVSAPPGRLTFPKIPED